ncbi:MAG TPA: RluA family pseudouridine synthase [Xanthobacteraceae bacterium]|nr:RluA family pseudouridine synthase [Xanthobacteraceae bacterium]
MGEEQARFEGHLDSVTVGAEEGGERLDRVLAAHVTALSRTRLKALVLAGHVAIGGRTIRDPGHRVNAGDRLTVVVPPSEEAAPQAERIPLAIVHEDDDLIIIDKPKGLVVHPAAGNRTGTLVNALIAHCGAGLSGIGGVKRPGIVHRLDKDTTGLMVVAKNDRAHQALAKQFADHGRTGPLERAYLAFVWGVPERPRGTIDKPLGRHSQARERMTVRQDGRAAVTHYEVLERYYATDGKPIASLLLCRLMTGRTHQIRVHLASMGHPLLGDHVYGAGFRTKGALLGEPARAALLGLGRQALHAHILGIEHPITGQHQVYRSQLPSDLDFLRKALRGTNPRAAG